MSLIAVSLHFLIWTPSLYIARVATTSTKQQLNPEKFWITANLLSIEWKPDCLTITYCNKPELKMMKTNSINGEKSSFSWRLDENFEQLSNSVFISHWTEGSPADIEITLEVVGIDPKYRFQRSCDHTLATKAFAYEVQEKDFDTSNPGNGSNRGQMIVELPGRCFDASLTVQKHINRFPWCVKSETATSASKEPSENGFSLINLLVLICIIALCPIIMSAFLWTLNRYVESTRKKQKTTVLPSVQLPNWKVMKSDTNGNLIIVGAVPQCNGIGSKSSLKSDSLTNSGTSDATYENSDKVNKSCQSLPVHNSIYESVVHSDYD